MLESILPTPFLTLSSLFQRIRKSISFVLLMGRVELMLIVSGCGWFVAQSRSLLRQSRPIARAWRHPTFGPASNESPSGLPTSWQYGFQSQPALQSHCGWSKLDFLF